MGSPSPNHTVYLKNLLRVAAPGEQGSLALLLKAALILEDSKIQSGGVGGEGLLCQPSHSMWVSCSGPTGTHPLNPGHVWGTLLERVLPHLLQCGIWATTMEPLVSCLELGTT